MKQFHDAKVLNISIFRYSKNYGSLTPETRIKDAVNMEDLICLLATFRTLKQINSTKTKNLSRTTSYNLQSPLPLCWLIPKLISPKSMLELVNMWCGLLIAFTAIQHWKVGVRGVSWITQKSAIKGTIHDSILKFYFFPHLVIFLQFRDPSYVLNLSTKAVLQKWHI